MFLLFGNYKESIRLWNTLKIQSTITQLDWKPLAVKKKKKMCWEWSHDNTTKYLNPQAGTWNAYLHTPSDTEEHIERTHPALRSTGSLVPLSDPKVTRQQVYKGHCWNVAQRDNNKELMDHFTWRLVSCDAKLKVGSSNQSSRISQSHTWRHFYALWVNAPSSSVWPTTIHAGSADSAAMLYVLRTSENCADTQQKMCLMCQRGSSYLGSQRYRLSSVDNLESNYF